MDVLVLLKRITVLFINFGINSEGKFGVYPITPKPNKRVMIEINKEGKELY